MDLWTGRNPPAVRRGAASHRVTAPDSRGPTPRRPLPPACRVTDPDAAALRRVAGGDGAALEALIARFAGPLGRTLARLAAPGGPAAEDLLQETFVRVWTRAGTFDGRAKASTWVFQIALNVARDAARRRSVRNAADRTAADPRTHGHAPHAPPAGACAATDDARERVRAAVAELPADLREPLALRHFGGLTAAEAGAVLNLPPGTVKDRARRALLALRPALRELDPADDR